MEEDYPDNWYEEDDNGESNADRYMDELDQEPREWSASEAYLEVCWHQEGGK